MKITKEKLKQIIKEELEAVLAEDELEETDRPSGTEEWWNSLTPEQQEAERAREREYSAHYR